ncbi:unnamed protein product [Moneuplotes crassus]|uniref:Uncharacterized protein n=1 Tax=Euplotes crassus TaxID=5936 RepID=A0AAD1XI02_EUPCR|nr:unnamed protein product [Moneuplotes crassus]
MEETLIDRRKMGLGSLEKSVNCDTKEIDKILEKALWFNFLKNELTVEESESCLDTDEIEEIDFTFKSYLTVKFYKKIHFTRCFYFGRVICEELRGTERKAIYSLYSSFPKRVNSICMSACYDFTLNICHYFNEIMKRHHQVDQHLALIGFRISFRQLKRVIAAYSHVIAIYLDNCKITVSGIPNFTNSLKNTKIQTFSFNHQIDAENYSWDANPQEFVNLVQGLATSPDLRKSLSTIYTCNDEIQRDKVREILDENGFENVKC